MEKNNEKKVGYGLWGWAGGALAAGFFVYVFFLSLNPLSDPDLWWHLKTGQMTVENFELPGRTDPFSYTSPNPLSDSQVRGLRSQWLGQAMLFLVFKAGGYAGLAVMRTLLIIIPYLFLVLWAYRRGIGIWRTIGWAALPLLFIGIENYYTYERPQAFSFIFFLALFFMLEKELRSGWPGGIKQWLQALGLPALMAVWPNLHGGYIVGAAVIAVYIAADAVSRLLRKIERLAGFFEVSEDPARFYGVLSSGLLATGLNPGGYALLIGWIQGIPQRLFHPSDPSRIGVVGAEILEYKSVFYFLRNSGFDWPPFVIAFAVLTAIFMLVAGALSKRPRLHIMLAGLAVVCLGLYYVRALNFMFIAAAFAAVSLTESERPRKLLLAISASALALAAFMTVYIYMKTPWDLKPSVSSNWVSPAYPERPLRFLEEHKVAGPMFNHLRWGGYIIWRTYPNYKVFYDGRSIGNEMMDLYARITRGEPQWEGYMDTFGVNFLLVPVISMENGVVFPPVMNIAERGRDSGWRLVYLWDNQAIFVRDSAGNRDVIECCEIGYGELYKEVSALADLVLLRMPGNRNALLSKAMSHIWMGERSKALDILDRLPDDGFARSLRNRAEKGGP